MATVCTGLVKTGVNLGTDCTPVERARTLVLVFWCRWLDCAGSFHLEGWDVLYNIIFCYSKHLQVAT